MTCIDCTPGSKRPTPHPGPRCVTHHRAIKRLRSEAAHEKRVQSVYGLGPGEYAELLAFQEGKCFICRRASGKTRRLSVDHDHKTGKVRGLLCRPCNTILGRFHDDAETYYRGYVYLNRPPYDSLLERKRAADEQE